MSLACRSPSELAVCRLGSVPYREALAIQERVRAGRRAGELPDTLLLLEHPPVYTRGRRSEPGELALGEDFYRAKGIEVLDTDRGGRVTYHGPGQLVGYPIMQLADLDGFLRTMEAAIIGALAAEGVTARSRHAEGIDYTGVWVGERKIASIGLHVSHGIATHGFAVNVDNDLQPFSWVVACGLPDVGMTSLARELGAEAQPRLTRAPGPARQPALRPHPSPLFERFCARMTESFCRAHGRRARRVFPAQLAVDAANALGGAPAGAELLAADPPAALEAVGA